MATNPDAGMLTPEQVFLIQNHDEAYTVWRDLGVRNRILVHIDAHHDMYGKWPAADNNRPQISIANYIYPSVEAGLVREVVWVAPDDTLANRSGRNWCRETVRKITAVDPSLPQDRSADKPRPGAAVLGRPLRYCTLDELAGINEPVLLDIDVDFMIIADSAHQGSTGYGDLPWCWPGELLQRLARAGLHTDLVTIACSVTGGYTPLQWKYLGDELAARIGGNATPELITAAERMRQASSAAAQGDLATAAVYYTAARELWPESGGPSLHLAHLNASLGQLDAARAFYREALERDTSYRTPFSSAGFSCYAEGRFDAAEAAFKRILLLDPLDPHANCGLGLVAIQRRRWSESVGYFQQALASDPNNVDALRGIGVALAGLGRNAEAIKVFEKSLRLSLAGNQSVLDTHIVTNPVGAHFSDPLHAQVHAWLGQLYAAQGETGTAIASCRMGIALGEDSLTTRLRLARLYLRRKEWNKGANQVGAALKNMPAQMAGAVHNFSRRANHGIRAWQAAKAHSPAPARAPSLWC